MDHPTFKERLLNFYRGHPLGVFGVLLLFAAVGAVLGMFLLVSIFERKQEARNPFFRVVELTDETEDPAIWGKDFPMQYDGYRRTVDQQRTRFGGSEAVPRTPTQADPRSIVAQSRIEEDPRLKTMWAGYAFARDFREERGHAFMLDDQTYTERQQAAKQPGTCLHCHASIYVPYKKAGGGDLMKGYEKFNQMPFAEARKLVTHPVACIDCHDPRTMQLRISRPGFIEGMRALKAGAGVKDYDVNRDATRQEMRSFVCGQCHVEYYFKGPEKRLVYPWANGLKVEQILAYYDAAQFKDWSHAETGAPALKAQHPEFELWNQGIHARSGVACADCHMPYKREGALKISDHQSDAEHQSRLPDVSQMAGSGIEEPGRSHPGADLSHAQPCHGRAHRPHRRPQSRARCECACRATHRRAGLPAQSAVLSRLHRSGKLVGVPCAAGSTARARRGDQLRPQRPACAPADEANSE